MILETHLPPVAFFFSGTDRGEFNRLDISNEVGKMVPHNQKDLKVCEASVKILEGTAKIYVIYYNETVRSVVSHFGAQYKLVKKRENEVEIEDILQDEATALFFMMSRALTGIDKKVRNELFVRRC